MRNISDLLIEHAYFLGGNSVFVPGAVDEKILNGRIYDKNTGQDLGPYDLNIIGAVSEKAPLYPECMENDYYIPKKSPLFSVMQTLRKKRTKST